MEDFPTFPSLAQPVPHPNVLKKGPDGSVRDSQGVLGYLRSILVETGPIETEVINPQV